MQQPWSILVAAALLPACAAMPAGKAPDVIRAASDTAISQAASAKTIALSRDIFQNRALSCVVATGAGRWDNALGMSVQYAPVRELRLELNRALGKELTFYKGWNPEGEAHVTVINPAEYYASLAGGQLEQPILSMTRIGELAHEANIQSADLKVLGLGSGRKLVDGKVEETYFLIVDSPKLRQFRERVHREFIAHGGKSEAWDPTYFYPHITIGFTKMDLHDTDGVIKDLAHSLDKRFKLKIGS